MHTHLELSGVCGPIFFFLTIMACIEYCQGVVWWCNFLRMSLGTFDGVIVLGCRYERVILQCVYVQTQAAQYHCLTLWKLKTWWFQIPCSCSWGHKCFTQNIFKFTADSFNFFKVYTKMNKNLSFLKDKKLKCKIITNKIHFMIDNKWTTHFSFLLPH